VAEDVELDAVTVKVVVAVTVVGVPDKTPLTESTISPAGNAGDTDQDVGVPVIVGLTGVIAAPVVKTKGFPG